MYIIFYFFVYLKYKLIEINLYPYPEVGVYSFFCLLLGSVMVRLITDLKYFVFVWHNLHCQVTDLPACIRQTRLQTSGQAQPHRPCKTQHTTCLHCNKLYSAVLLYCTVRCTTPSQTPDGNLTVLCHHFNALISSVFLTGKSAHLINLGIPF